MEIDEVERLDAIMNINVHFFKEISPPIILYHQNHNNLDIYQISKNELTRIKLV